MITFENPANLEFLWNGLKKNCDLFYIKDLNGVPVIDPPSDHNKFGIIRMFVTENQSKLYMNELIRMKFFKPNELSPDKIKISEFSRLTSDFKGHSEKRYGVPLKVVVNVVKNGEIVVDEVIYNSKTLLN